MSQIEGLLEAQAASLRSEEHGTLRRFAARLGELESQVGPGRDRREFAGGEMREVAWAGAKREGRGCYTTTCDLPGHGPHAPLHDGAPLAVSTAYLAPGRPRA